MIKKAHLYHWSPESKAQMWFIVSSLKVSTTKPLKLTLKVFLGLKSRAFSFWYTLKKGCAKACSAVKRTAGSTTSSLDIWETKHYACSLFFKHIITAFCLCSSVKMDMSYYQVFHSVRPVIPLRGAELISALHNHPQHQHLFPMPERRWTSQQGEKDHSASPSLKKIQIKLQRLWGEIQSDVRSKLLLKERLTDQLLCHSQGEFHP